MRYWVATRPRRFLFALLVTMLGVGASAVLRVLAQEGAPALMPFIPAVVVVTLYAGTGFGVACWVATLVAAGLSFIGIDGGPVPSRGDLWALVAFGVCTAISLGICASVRLVLREDEATLRLRAQEDTARAIRTRDEILSRLSHELRTPLSAILGWTQVLRAQTPSEQVARGLEVIERNARTQTKILDELIEAGQGAIDESRTRGPERPAGQAAQPGMSR